MWAKLHYHPLCGSEKRLSWKSLNLASSLRFWGCMKFRKVLVAGLRSGCWFVTCFRLVVYGVLLSVSCLVPHEKRISTFKICLTAKEHLYTIWADGRTGERSQAFQLQILRVKSFMFGEVFRET
ncbi:hypothetical protein Mal48_42790 [Thalassoglobus polymorphus]|uniref:Uncharacterized protein n=1 Tax=Thalassoglobus polymorphus TaxID=2527994 RepID=A0A517QTN8_9PLAN|nr:hypothetical protein Mal48_42790 [Thalassoglobus polymorphus]